MSDTNDFDPKLAEVIQTLHKKDKPIVYAHSDEKKGLGRAMIQAGYTQSAVGAVLGAGQSTVSNWVNEKPINDQEKSLANELIDQLAHKFAYTTNKCLDAVSPDKLAKSNTPQLLISAGISNKNMIDLLNRASPESPDRAMKNVIDIRARHEKTLSDRDNLNSDIILLKD